MGAEVNATPNPAAAENGSKKNDTVPLKIFGAEVPLPHWAVPVLAVFVIVCFPVFLFFSVKHMQADDHAAKDSGQKIEDLTKAKDELSKTNNALANAKKLLQESQAKATEANDSYQELTKHAGEAADWVHKDVRLIVTHYASDGCVSVVRPGVRQVKWEKDPARDAELGPAPGAVDGGVRGGLQEPGNHAEASPSSFKLTPSPAMAQLRMIDLNIESSAPGLQTEFVAAQVLSRNGRCLNPHPGRYSSYTGKVQGCWTQVWRRWSDGCTHYQWFNTCSSSWDADPNGRPRVYWTACAH
jgi:hypothetical protein